MTPEEEAEYAAMEELMNIYDGGGPDVYGADSEVEEKPWFERDERDQEVHDRER